MTAPIRLTLPGASVTREVTWEHVRAYLTREGWERISDSCIVGGGVGRVLREHVERWGGDVMLARILLLEDMRETISELARLADVAPGVMLARIVEPAPAPSEPPALGSWRDGGNGAHVLGRDGHTIAAMVTDPTCGGGARWQTICDGKVLAFGECPKVGEAMAAAEASLRRATDATDARRAAEDMRERAAALADSRDDVPLARWIRALPLDGGDR